MDRSDSSCPRCGTLYALDQQPPARCLNCGADLTTPYRTWRRIFWLLFFLTPVLTLGAGWFSAVPFPKLGLGRFLPQGLHFLRALPKFAAPAVLVVGAWGAGYFLARSHFRTTQSIATLIGASMVYGVGILVLYAAIILSAAWWFWLRWGSSK